MVAAPGPILAGALVVAGLGFASAAEAQVPTRVGTCAATTIARIGTRFSDTLVKPKGDGIGDGLPQGRRSRQDVHDDQPAHAGFLDFARLPAHVRRGLIGRP